MNDEIARLWAQGTPGARAREMVLRYGYNTSLEMVKNRVKEIEDRMSAEREPMRMGVEKEMVVLRERKKYWEEVEKEITGERVMPQVKPAPSSGQDKTKSKADPVPAQEKSAPEKGYEKGERDRVERKTLNKNMDREDGALEKVKAWGFNKIFAVCALILLLAVLYLFALNGRYQYDSGGFVYFDKWTQTVHVVEVEK